VRLSLFGLAFLSTVSRIDAQEPRYSLRGFLVGTDSMVSLDEFKQPLACPKASFPVHTFSRSLRATSCDLVARARESVARGLATDVGITPADSARITAAVTSRDMIKDSSGRIRDRYDSITLAIAGKDYSLAFKFENGLLSRPLKSEPLLLPP
jgi:hypothetical protein